MARAFCVAGRKVEGTWTTWTTWVKWDPFLFLFLHYWDDREKLKTTYLRNHSGENGGPTLQIWEMPALLKRYLCPFNRSRTRGFSPRNTKTHVTCTLFTFRCLCLCTHVTQVERRASQRLGLHPDVAKLLCTWEDGSIIFERSEGFRKICPVTSTTARITSTDTKSHELV